MKGKAGVVTLTTAVLLGIVAFLYTIEDRLLASYRAKELYLKGSMTQPISRPEGGYLLTESTHGSKSKPIQIKLVSWDLPEDQHLEPVEIDHVWEDHDLDGRFKSSVDTHYEVHDRKEIRNLSTPNSPASGDRANELDSEYRKALADAKPFSEIFMDWKRKHVNWLRDKYNGLFSEPQ